jgi:outer membrane autotransporter protein
MFVTNRLLKVIFVFLRLQENEMRRFHHVSHPLSLCMLAIATLCASVGASATEVEYSGSYGATTIGGNNQSVTAVLRGASFDALATDSLVTLQVGSQVNNVTGVFRADGARMGFAIAPAGTSGISAVGTGRLSVGSLILNGFENYGIQLGGSLKNGATANLIQATSVDANTPATIDYTEPFTPAMLTTAELPGEDRVNDNSYVITSRVRRVGNNMVYTATRAQDAYVSKASAYVGGHFSNNAALTLSDVAYEGRQQGDLATVIDRLDINDYGFGNTAANLAVQSKRLAPIANNAYVLSALSANDVMLSTSDDRLNTLRGGVVGTAKSAQKALWVQGFSQLGKQSGFVHQAELNAYDSFDTRLMGLTVGFDSPVATGWLGGALSLASGNIEQNDFRSGDSANSNNTQFSLYGTQEFGAAYAQMSLAWGQSDLTATRATAVGRTAHDAFKLQTSDARVGVGYRIKFKDGKSMLTPYASLQSARLKQPQRTETGAGDLSLQIAEKTYNRSRTQLGLRYSTESRLLGKPTFLSLQGAVSRDGGLDNMDVQASYTGQTTDLAFVTPAAPVDRTAFHFGVTTSMAMGKSSSLQLKFDLEHRRTYNAQGVQIKGLWLF